MARGLALTVYCDGCGKTLRDYTGRGWPGECCCNSLIGNFILCAKCAAYEEEDVRNGHTDKLLKRYRSDKG